MTHAIAVDLGATSGRVLSIELTERGFHQTELHRFANEPVFAGGTLYWDALRLWHEIRQGITKAPAGAQSIGLDAWGVDFALLDKHGRLLSNPVHYRDARANGMMEWVFERVPKREIYERTGLQFMQLNTLYQIASLVKEQSVLLDSAATYLSMPDLFLYWMGGDKVCEFTHATTTQFFDPRAGGWDLELLAKLGVPTHIFPQIVPPGTVTGDMNGIPVIVPGTHDTASAVVGIPTTTDDFAYISSGTWSLIGLETPGPVINDLSYAANATNEGGAYGTYRFLRNVAGMWLLEQSRATWSAAGHTYSYDELRRMVEEAPAFRSLFDPDHLDFLAPGDMPARIAAYCARTGQPSPETPGQVVRAIYESLALKYRHVLRGLISASGKHVSRMHIIGGGSQNAQLCQMTADALEMPVVAGPGEATAIGNAMVQFISTGALASLADARQLLASSVETRTYEPKHQAQFAEAAERFATLLS
ncbi:MAG: rhamnulokinase [Pleurocapsa minor GSE-CHR-MK-17-07R]|nr:rhamnulokinase [Pleurocapsa minor GSE-CHR-MK 17-07R]